MASGMERMSDGYRNGHYHGRCGMAPVIPADAGTELTRAMQGDMSPEPAFSWAFGASDYKKGYEAGLNDRFWTMDRIRHPDKAAMRAERQALIDALPWNRKVDQPTPKFLSPYVDAWVA